MPVMRVKPLYADMVSRVQAHCLSLVEMAQVGNEFGMLATAEQVEKQAGALRELLEMARKLKVVN